MLQKIGIYLSKEKNYNIKVVGNGENHLLVKGILNNRLSAMNLTKFINLFYEFRSKIKELELTKLETDHGNGTYSSMRIYFMYILFRIVIRFNKFKN